MNKKINLSTRSKLSLASMRIPILLFLCVFSTVSAISKPLSEYFEELEEDDVMMQFLSEEISTEYTVGSGLSTGSEAMRDFDSLSDSGYREALTEECTGSSADEDLIDSVYEDEKDGDEDDEDGGLPVDSLSQTDDGSEEKLDDSEGSNTSFSYSEDDFSDINIHQDAAVEVSKDMAETEATSDQDPCADLAVAGQTRGCSSR